LVNGHLFSIIFSCDEFYEKFCQQESVSSQGKRNKAFAVIKSDMEEKERRRKKENSKVKPG
jgi:hypothetical protein